MALGAVGGAALIGREVELATLVAACTQAAQGSGGVVRITGEAGVGKSSLLSATVDRVREVSVNVLRTRGVEEEQHLGFAALHRLLLPALGDLAVLPPAHRAALEGAFGLGREDLHPERFLVGLAVLELLAERAGDTGLIVVVDDCQWLDRTSRDVIGFVARRVDDLPVALLMTERPRLDGSDGSADVVAPYGDHPQEVHLRGLDPEDARTLLRLRAPDLPRSTERYVVDLAEGNPLALLELPLAGLSAGSGAADVRLSELSSPRLTGRLQEAFGARASALDPRARFACLVAALQDGDEITDTLAALRADARHTEVGGGRPETDLKGAADLVRVVGSTIQFRHPLVRAAVIEQAGGPERVRAHAALADALDHSPGRAGLHRAATLVDPDELVAADLENLGEGCSHRGAAGLARSLFEESARLSVAEEGRAHRVLRTAELAFELGDLDDVGPLIERVQSAHLSPPDRARLVGLQMAFDDGVPEGADAVGRFVTSAREALEAGQGPLAGSLLVVAARNTYWGASSDALGPDIAAVAARLGDSVDEQLLGLVLDAFLQPFAQGRAVVEELAVLADASLGDDLVALLSQAAFVVGDFQRSQQLAQRASVGLRRDGRLGLLAADLVLQAFSALYLGRWDVLLAAADEAERLAQETGQPVWHACARLGQANLCALRGDRSGAEAIAAEVEQVALLSGNRSVMNGTQLSRGLAALGSEDPDQACVELARMFDEADYAFQSPQYVWALDYLAEAAAASGRTMEIRDIVEAVSERVGATTAAGVRRAVALARLMTASDDEIEAAYAAACGVPSTAWHQARRDLFYGAWLRRHRRVRAARPLLRTASATFEAIGAARWSARARDELIAVGESSEGRGPARDWTRLSAQELQVATLAAQGLSNQEIASRLYISQRTVASHLYRSYPKLGIRSRAQLHMVLPDEAQD